MTFLWALAVFFLGSASHTDRYLLTLAFSSCVSFLFFWVSSDGADGGAQRLRAFVHALLHGHGDGAAPLRGERLCVLLLHGDVIDLGFPNRYDAKVGWRAPQNEWFSLWLPFRPAWKGHNLQPPLEGNRHKPTGNGYGSVVDV